VVGLCGREAAAMVGPISEASTMNDMAPTAACRHHWVVFSTALQEGWLMLQCTGCGLHGAVEDPTLEEWSRAYNAPSAPYPWTDEARVTLHPEVRTAADYWARQVPPAEN
jgi:hypothetical protein